jgi:hypothetical protein
VTETLIKALDLGYSLGIENVCTDIKTVFNQSSFPPTVNGRKSHLNRIRFRG